jgi:hypothetical protein
MRGALRKKREDIPMKRFQAILLKQNIAVTEPVLKGIGDRSGEGR